MDYPVVFRQLARLPPVPLIVQDAHETTPPAYGDLLRLYDEANNRGRFEWAVDSESCPPSVVGS